MAFFWNIIKIAQQLGFCPQGPGLWYALVAPVCWALCPIEAFFKQKFQFLGTLTQKFQAPSLNKILVAVNGATRGAKGA